jgi:CubicO group peptidase (beta-lactamase class C family)
MKISLKRNLHRFFLLALLAGLAPVSVAFDNAQLSEFTQRGMDLWHVPGMSVAVVTKDEVLFRQGFGQTALEDGRAVDEHTLFAIASTTKAMVVAGILMLVDEEKLSLDDPIIKYIPELHFENPMLTKGLMVRDLLAHRTGLPSTDYWSFLQDMPLDEQLERLRNVPAEAPVRTRLIYQNTMFEIAGLLIERLSGQRWHDFLGERLWRPVGMLETYAERAQIGVGQTHVTPYFYVEDKLTVADWDIPADYADAAGSVWSSIRDMSLWAQFLLRDGVTASGDRLISEAGMAQMFEPQQLATADDFYPTVELTKPNWRTYGLAWFQQDFQGRKIDFHTGSLSGLIAIIGLDRANDKAVIVLGNRDHAEMRHALLWEVMDNGGPEKRRDWNQEIFDLYAARAEKGRQGWKETEKKRLKHTQPALPIAAYAGSYGNPAFGDIRIENAGSGMKLHTTLVDFEMSHWHHDTFLVEHESWDMHEFATFTIDGEGSITSVNVFGETFKRAPSE